MKTLIEKSLNRHDFPTKEREKLAKEGEAMKDGSFPIRNEQDLKDAIRSIGRAKDPAAARRWIKKRAKELGKESLLPEDWKEGGDIEKSRVGRYEDTSENRRLHRVGQEYGSKGGGGKDEKGDGESKITSEDREDMKKDAELIEKKINQMKKNKHLFLEYENGEKRYNKSLEILQNKLDILRKEISNRYHEEKRKVEEEPKKEKSDLAKEIARVNDKATDVEKETKTKKTEAENSEKTSKAALEGNKPDSPDDKIKKQKLDKESDPIYQIQKKKKEAQKVYDDKREKAQKAYNEEGDKIREEIDKLFEKDDSDSVKKRKSLWDDLKKKSNEYDKETTRLKDEYEAQYKKLDEAEDKLYDNREKKDENKPDDLKEGFTRVKFEDIPNSVKVNLKKYLSTKARKDVDGMWELIDKIDTEGLQKMEKGLVEDFNRQFDDLPKARRAEKLYAIMKVKGELQKRGSEPKNTEK